MTFTVTTIKKLRALGLDEPTVDRVLEIFEEAKQAKPKKGGAADREARGTRLPETWVIPTDWMERAKAMGMSTNEANREAAKFKNYWTNQPGQKGIKLTWPRTWDNWCISMLERAGRQPVLASDTPKSAEGPEAFTDATWRAIAKRYKSSGQQWSPDWGPPPSSMGCLMPVEYL